MSAARGRVVLELTDVAMQYRSRRNTFDHGRHRVLESVSLQLFDGETLGVIGRNGCGKSTILRLLAGIIPPTSGRVYIEPGKRAAMLTLGLGFKPNLSGRDNAILSGMLQGASRRDMLQLLPAIREFSELEDSFDEPVKTYSSGMRSRLGFSTALMTHIDIMLVDEVLSVGDEKFRLKAEAAIKQRIEGDQTVVFVSHSAPQVRLLCSRVVWINEGRVAAEGEPGRVLDAYQAFLNAGGKSA